MPNGTTVPFDPLKASDTMTRAGEQAKHISTKHMCITAMKTYDAKSVEVFSRLIMSFPCLFTNLFSKELRVEDYMANRKFGTGAGATSAGSIFGPQGMIFRFKCKGHNLQKKRYNN
jgi:nuclear pore complex protein Nup98-Nup96